MTDLEKRIQAAKKWGYPLSAADKAAAELEGLDTEGIKTIEAKKTVIEKNDDSSYTGGGKLTSRTYGESAETNTAYVDFKGRQPERTEIEKEEIKEILAELDGPEARKRAAERARNLPGYVDCREDYDSDF
jgi:hypothetical protein